MNILVVGQNPGNGSGKTLNKLYNWMDKVNVKYFSFMNAYEYPGSIKEQTPNFNLLSSYWKYRKIVALGNEASKILNYMGIEHLKMPHPSGLNRKLNDKQYEEDCIKLLRDYVEEN